MVAVGGNALAPSGLGTLDEQTRLAGQVAAAVVDLVAAGLRVLVVHGNGPQVGALALAQEALGPGAAAQPLHVLGAMTQGQLGWLLSTTVGDALAERGLPRDVTAVVTQVVVDPDDPGFAKPSKPIGPFFPAGRARRLAQARGWDVAEDSGRGWRRIVPSPVPVEVVEGAQIAGLLRRYPVVIACGGGGIPVVRRDATLHGIEAVIDKDLAAALVGRQVGAATLLLLTGVDRVALDFGTDRERWVDEMSVAEARGHLADGQFPAGSMGPKVDAAVRFVTHAKRRTAIIASLDGAVDALAGRAGTRIVP